LRNDLLLSHESSGSTPGCCLSGSNGAYHRALSFYRLLEKEVLQGNPYLADEEQDLLRGHYPHIVHSRYPAHFLAAIFSRRRARPLEALSGWKKPLVFDAGCGFGSDSFLFAGAGASVLGMDSSAGQIHIARKRQRYYEELLGAPLDITFESADLNGFVPGEDRHFSLTWLASVLAVIRDQEDFLKRIFEATRTQGRIMIVDFNLWHPPFLWKEWLRRRRALKKSREFGRRSDFWAMVRRKGRAGARFFPAEGGGFFDDVQFFTPGTLALLLRNVGFTPLSPAFTVCAPPVSSPMFLQVELFLSRVPLWRSLGRAYLVTGIK
jgi:SAM-dependent methyltransferase